MSMPMRWPTTPGVCLAADGLAVVAVYQYGGYASW